MSKKHLLGIRNGLFKLADDNLSIRGLSAGRPQTRKWLSKKIFFEGVNSTGNILFAGTPHYPAMQNKWGIAVY